ncbi:MAG: ClpXP protease specificity-enhancing factor [Betaproteobacteria bacterium]|nr:ClpXP protease specificity-enhancing factor [Betaproteobacteria bacterium]
MNMNSTKPYLLRSIYDWCLDSGFTPFITVTANQDLGLPVESAKNGEIIFNIGQNAVQNLVIDNDIIYFEARFNGVSRKIELPMEVVKGIFAKEVKQGIAFQEELELDVDLKETKLEKNASKTNTPSRSPRKTRKPKLRVVK